MTERSPWVGAIFWAALLALVALSVGGAPAEIAFVLSAGAFPVLLIAVGASRRGRLPTRLRWLLALIAAELVGSLLWLVTLRGQVDEGGWPLAGSVLLWGLWLSPLLVVGFGYACVFDRETLRDEDLARLRRTGSGAESGNEI